MCSKVFSGTEVTLAEILAAREERQEIQYALMGENEAGSLLSATMNIPGTVKNSKLIKQAFEEILIEVEHVLSEFPPLKRVFVDKPTGVAFFALVPLLPKELKKRMVTIEEVHHFGRLVDLDVLYLENQQLQSISRRELGHRTRRCLLCEEDAKICGRSRAHDTRVLQEKIVAILTRKDDKDE